MEAGWLSTVAGPLIELSAPLDAPAPHYSEAVDAVVATHAVSFGRHGWQLPSVEKPLSDNTLQARVFAAALLAGRVLPALAGWSNIPCMHFFAGSISLMRTGSGVCGLILLQKQLTKHRHYRLCWCGKDAVSCRAATCLGGASGQGSGSGEPGGAESG